MNTPKNPRKKSLFGGAKRLPVRTVRRPWMLCTDDGLIAERDTVEEALKFAAWCASGKWWATATGWRIEHRDTGTVTPLGADGRVVPVSHETQPTADATAVQSSHNNASGATLAPRSPTCT